MKILLKQIIKGIFIGIAIVLIFVLGFGLAAWMFGADYNQEGLDWDWSHTKQKNCLYYWIPTSKNHSVGHELFCL